MEQFYDKIIKTLSCILEPAPLNQLGMPSYYRHILAVLSQIKEQIESMEAYYKSQLNSWENVMDEEF